MTGRVSRFELRRRFNRKADEQRRRQARDQQRRKREQREDKADAMCDALVQLASSSQRAFWEERIERLETATVAALLDNDARLRRAQQTLRDLENRAFVLPDGRRVYRTQVGDRVYDEQGNAIPASELDPRAISPERPDWNAHRIIKAEHNAALAERQELLDYQAKLDQARNTLDDRNLTADALEDLGADLESSMPAAVRQQMAEMDGAEPRPLQRHQPPAPITVQMVPPNPNR